MRRPAFTRARVMEAVVETLSPEQLALLKSMLERRLDALAHAEPPAEPTPTATR